MPRTSGLQPEPWPWPDRPRVLVESPDDWSSLELASALRRAGYGVAVCPGPREHERCPLAGPQGCAVAHGADVVVSSLGLARPESREVLESLRARCPEVPIVVEVGADDERSWPELLDGCELVGPPRATEQVVAAVGRALARGG